MTRSLLYRIKIIKCRMKNQQRSSMFPLVATLQSVLVSAILTLLVASIIQTTSAKAIDTGAVITSLCTQLQKDAAPFEIVDFDMSKCTCAEIPDACKELETLPYNFDTTCNKLLDKLLPAEYIGLVTCSCDMFDNACKWFKKQNEGSSGGATVRIICVLNEAIRLLAIILYWAKKFMLFIWKIYISTGFVLRR